MHVPLLYALASEAINIRSENLCAQNLANTAWSFAALAVAHEPLLSSISSSSLSILQEFGTQGLSNSAWAFSVRQMIDHP